MLQTTQIKQGLPFIVANKVTPAQIKPQSFKSRRNSFLFFFTLGGCVSCLRACFGARLLLQSYQYPNLSEGADRVAGQLRGYKECPFSGVTKSGRVWRKVPESNARSVHCTLSGVLCTLLGAQAPRLISVLMLTDTLFCNFSFGGMHINVHVLILSYVSV